ncbi:MAG TPA: hypothetical protein VGO93_21600 [Candidatus Xenobia bacterium]|jgi:hypothetical protein
MRLLAVTLMAGLLLCAPAMAQVNETEVGTGLSIVTANAAPSMYHREVVVVTLHGLPGQHATCDVANLTNVPMFETTPGLYVGRVILNEPNVQENVVVHLMPVSGSMSDISAPPALSIAPLQTVGH